MQKSSIACSLYTQAMGYSTRSSSTIQSKKTTDKTEIVKTQENKGHTNIEKNMEKKNKRQILEKNKSPEKASNEEDSEQ